MSRSTFLVPLLGTAFLAAMTGCASTNAPESEIARQLEESQARIADLERTVDQRADEIETLENRLASSQLPAVQRSREAALTGQCLES